MTHPHCSRAYAPSGAAEARNARLAAAMAPMALMALLAWATQPAQAHRTWLLPSATLLTGKDPLVSVDAAVSEDLFEFDTTALPLEGLTITAPDGSAATAENRSSARRRSSFDVKLPQAGTYRIANFSETVTASYKVGSETRRWRGAPDAYAAFVKELPREATELQATRVQNRVETFVTYERPRVPPFTPAGVGLELEPLAAPTDLSVGDTSEFRLWLDGKPAADADVTVLRGGNRYRYKLGEIALKTEAQGRFGLQWPEAGRYLVHAVHGRRGGAPEGAAAPAPALVAAPPARRASYSATVEVLPQ
jgi:uncharacterized GH25 family protein